MTAQLPKTKWRHSPGPMISDYIAAYRKVHPQWPDPGYRMDETTGGVRIEAFGGSLLMFEKDLKQAIADLDAAIAKRAPKPALQPKMVKRGKAHDRIIAKAAIQPIVLTHDPAKGDKFTFRGKPVPRRAAEQCIAEGWMKPNGDGLFTGDSQTYVPS